MQRRKPNSKAGKKKSSPIRVVVRCAWSGARLTVPTTTADNSNDPLPPIRGSSTLLDLVLRLDSALPPSLFDAAESTATLVCLRKLVPQSQWESTTLKQMMDGDDGSAGVVLTLELGSAAGGGNRAGSAPQKSNPVKNAISSAASSLNIKPVVVAAAASTGTTRPTPATIATLPEPMDTSNDVTMTDTNNKVMLSEEAWDKVLLSNFDATTKDCLNTLLKIIDNLLSRPNEPKVRSMRCANAAFEKKVGRCTGGYDFLYSIGFAPKYPVILGGGTTNTAAAAPEFLELTPENESRETLLRGRKVLSHSAVKDLGMAEEDLPAVLKAPASLPPSTLVAPPSATSAGSNNSRGPTSGFNVYKTHSHNIQSAAVGAPDPYNEAASSVSTTERRLQALQSKKEKMERDMQSEIEADRGLVAYLAGSGPAPVAAATTGGGVGVGKTDSSLVAARMRRMEEERKKRDEGGFTTKAMRDLEKIKKAKVYSHAQIRINFSDGTNLHAKFLPREKVSSIRSVIQSAFRPSLTQSLRFDLYVAPPRRLLDDAKTLEEEGLVPAAKIHVSWKAGTSPAGGYLRDELFVGGNAATSAFPDAKPIVKEPRALAKSKGKNNTGNGNGDSGPSKEDLMMQRMLGKKTGLLGGRKSSSNEPNEKNGKPKWFKK